MAVVPPYGLVECREVPQSVVRRREKAPACLYSVNEAKGNLTLSELVVKLDEIKFECTISPKFDVIHRMKI